MRRIIASRGSMGLGTSFGTVRESLLAREVSGLWVAELIGLATGVVQAVLVARLLGPLQFGTATLVLSSVTLVFGLLDPQAREAVVKYLGAHHVNGRVAHALAVPKVAYTTDAVLGVIGFAIVTGGARWFEQHVVHSDSNALIIVFGAASMFSAPLATSRAVLTTFRRFQALAVLKGVSSLLRLALMVGFVVVTESASGVVYATGISIVLESLATSILADRAVRTALGSSWWHGRRSTLGSEFREILRFMAYTDLTSLVTVFVKEADLVVLGYVRGPTEVGYYRLARSVATPMPSLVTPLQQVVYPRLAALAGVGDHVGLRAAARRYMLRVGAPLAALSLCAAPFLPFLVPAVAGDEYRPAVGAATILFVGIAVTLPAFWTRSILLAGGHLRFLLGLSVGATALTIVGYFVLGNLFGSVGIATTRVLVAGIGGSGLAVLYFFRLDEPGGKQAPLAQPIPEAAAE